MKILTKLNNKIRRLLSDYIYIDHRECRDYRFKTIHLEQDKPNIIYVDTYHMPRVLAEEHMRKQRDELKATYPEYKFVLVPIQGR